MEFDAFLSIKQANSVSVPAVTQHFSSARLGRSTLQKGARFMSKLKTVYGASHVPLSPAVRAGDFVYISGQVPTDANGNVVVGGIEAQTKQTLENVKAALALAGCTMDQVVKTFVILTDARDFGGFNKTYATFFPTEPPARTTVEARLMIDIKVEIEAIAYAPVS